MRSCAGGAFMLWYRVLRGEEQGARVASEGWGCRRDLG